MKPTWSRESEPRELVLHLDVHLPSYSGFADQRNVAQVMEVELVGEPLAFDGLFVLTRTRLSIRRMYDVPRMGCARFGVEQQTEGWKVDRRRYLAGRIKIRC